LEFGSVDFLFLQELQTNIYTFSAAKTYQQVRILNGLMFQYRDRPDLFFKEAKELFNTYNTPRGKNYLSAEYQTAKSQALMGRKWKKFIDDKELFGCLVYQTVGDSRVRDSHRRLQGFKAPVNDPIWKTISPANDWRCRCDLIQVECGFDNFVNISRDQMIEVVPIEFRFNVWFDKIVFSPKHPYFKVARGDKELALNNFNLPLP
jgi:SPP1 gp7 family putative phage head morphogenesis protein